jgi:hypothetical protein
MDRTSIAAPVRATKNDVIRSDRFAQHADGLPTMDGWISVYNDLPVPMIGQVRSIASAARSSL